MGAEARLDAPDRRFLYCRMERVSQRQLLLIALAVLALITGAMSCSKKEARYPADAARYKRIDKAVEALRKAYVQKDASAFHAWLLPTDQVDRMESHVLKDFQQYQDIAVELSIERIVIDGEQIDVFVHWQGIWKKDEGATERRERGHGMLRWKGMNSILLTGYEGDIPFGLAARPADAPPTPPPGTPSTSK
jgi:hypothetical protein